MKLFISKSCRAMLSSDSEEDSIDDSSDDDSIPCFFPTSQSNSNESGKNSQ